MRYVVFVSMFFTNSRSLDHRTYVLNPFEIFGSVLEELHQNFSQLRFRKYQGVFEFSQTCGFCAGTLIRIRGVIVGSVIRMKPTLKSTEAVLEILGALVPHIGSDISIKSALLWTPWFCWLESILNYFDGFNIANLHMVYEVFSLLSLSAQSNVKSVGYSIANELLMIMRKQIHRVADQTKRISMTTSEPTECCYA